MPKPDDRHRRRVDVWVLSAAGVTSISTSSLPHEPTAEDAVDLLRIAAPATRLQTPVQLAVVDVPASDPAFSFRRLASHVPLAIGMVACLLLWFVGLGQRALGEPDEGRYAEVAREMFVSGDWITPHLNGFNFFDKPALHYWATSIFYALFGVNAWAARLWVALSGLLTVFAIGWTGRRLYGAMTGWTAMLVTASSLLFAAGSHTNTLDMGVAAFLNIAMCFFLVAQFDSTALRQRTPLNLLGWTCLALAVLSKGLIGLVLPFLTLIVFMLWQRDWTILKQLSLGRGLVLIAVIAVPWFVLISLRHADFLNYFFIKEHFARFLTKVDDRGHAVWYFLPIVLFGMLPWAVFLPLRKVDWRGVYSGAPVERFLLAWVGVVLVFFSVSRSKLPFYILPLFPILSLLVARAISLYSKRKLSRRLVALVVIALVAVVLALTLKVSSRHLSNQIDFHAAMVWLALAFALIALAAGAAAAWLRSERKRLPALAALGATALLAWQVFFIGLARVTPDISAASVAGMVRAHLQKDTEVFTVNAYIRGLPFYLERLVTVVAEEPDDIAPGFASYPEGVIPSIGGFETRWRAATNAIAVVDPGMMQRLRADELPMTVLGNLPNGVVVERPGEP